jgi:hypothetical protein
MEMDQKLIGLSIALKESENHDAFFQDQMTHTILSALSIIYSEAFIWTMGNHMGVWVVGIDSELLVKIFLRNHIKYTDIQLVMGIKAEDLFEDIVEGRVHRTEAMELRMDSFYHGFEQSMDLNCLGPRLFPLVNNAKLLFANNMKIVGLQNSVSSGSTSPQVICETPGFLYRFSVN